ncbi:MFS transporter [Planctomycetota bacterium]
MSQTAEAQAWSAERDRYFARNYIFHCMEGGIFDGGLHLVDYLIVLPPLILMLGGDAYAMLAGLMPAMIPIGFMLPGLFVAHWIERLEHFKGLNLITGIISRLFFLMTGLVVIFLHESHPILVLWTVALSPLLLGLPLGVSAPGWMTMISRMIPANRLASSFAIRLFSGALLGLGAGIVVKIVLEKWEGREAVGFGILFLIAFGVLMLSYIAFAMLREVPGPPTRGAGSFFANIKAVPVILRKDRQMRKFVLAILTGGGIFIPIPMLSEYILRFQGIEDGRGGKAMALLGVLLMWKLGGGVIGNMLGGFLGDLRGSKIVLVIGRITEVALCIWLFFAGSMVEFYLIQILVGIIEVCIRVGNPTMVIEISPASKRVMYAGLASLASIVGITCNGALGAYLWGATHSMAAAAIPALVLCGLSTVFLLQIREPRRNRAA